ncbi:glutathione S-transferase [Shewanella psychrophila]|uniref:Glutathione S-transferase n=1 Tax=Shewanella psychrophila TaxID=225848 RepID=A0A1S6HVX0_9GAMM|nr:glutathione S-transferase family protein [Shewanella psychrophila]AQS39651.1 glutathione S-transferase [Shewanella psychrophila]
MINIISFKVCPFFQYVTSMLEAIKLPYEVEYADFDNCLFDISPNGKAPVLITESGEALFDADAIVSYLESLHGRLYQAKTNEEAALIEAWANYGSKNYVPQCSTMRSETQPEFEAYLDVFEKAIANMERQLGKHSYFMGEEISRVDIAWLPILYRARLVEDGVGFDFFANYPSVKQWQKTLLSLDIAKQSVSGDFEQVFNDFYLSTRFQARRNKASIAS